MAQQPAQIGPKHLNVVLIASDLGGGLGGRSWRAAIGCQLPPARALVERPADGISGARRQAGQSSIERGANSRPRASCRRPVLRSKARHARQPRRHQIRRAIEVRGQDRRQSSFCGRLSNGDGRLVMMAAAILEPVGHDHQTRLTTRRTCAFQVGNTIWRDRDQMVASG